jgi:hypothetical protein
MALPYEIGDLLELERRVLDVLVPPSSAMGVICPPTSSDAALLKTRIARFLHDHKDDWDSR